ncbi:MAG: filamentous hemagglutinin N-terminal domain-containing protein [Nitrospira sp.]|nr:MAG: filamentous hemagglutinin N-terminal domain-containing protein [Nitrospira sp.]
MDERIARSCHADGMKQAFLWALLPILLLVPTAPDAAYAQIVTNITSSGLGTVVPLQPPSDGVYNITGGTRPGVNGLNLFHSFGDFTVGPGDIANFLNNTGLETSNIIGRVTELGVEHTSYIYGTIRTTDFGDANLFLVNPSGIVFGPQGSFDVGGSVSMSTADYLRFEGHSALFDTLSSPASLGLLDVAPVVAFGFTSLEPPAPITVQGSLLQVPEGKALSLVGGDITLQAEPFEDGTMQAANLRAPGGQLNLVSVASPGEVLVPSFQTGPNIAGASFTTMGTVMLKEGATLDVSGQLDEFGAPIGNGNSGTVFVRGGQLVMEASTIQAITWGSVDGERAAVDIQVSQAVALTSATIVTLTFGSGRAGDVLLTAPTLTIENAPQSIFTTTGEGGGVGGDVILNVGTVSLMGGSSIESSSQMHNATPGLGQGGNVTIQGLEGSGSAAESVALFGDSSLSSVTSGSGDGGRVAITSKSVTMDGFATTVASRTEGVGLPGDIVVSVQHANLSGGATITTLSGSTDSNASEAATVTVQGLGDPGSMADSVALSGLGSGIVSDTQGLASAGDVAVHAKTVILTDGAAIQSGTPLTSGAGGIVTIDAGSVDISGGSIIRSLANRAAAGEIIIMANTLILANGFIASKTVSSSRGGDVELNVGNVSLSNSATIDSSASGTGRAGDITMNVGTLSLANGSEISSASIGTEAITNPDDGTIQAPGTAGNVVITAAGRFTSDGSIVATSAEANHGGDVSITAHSVQLSNGTLITANSNAPLVVKETVLIDGLPVEQVVGDGNAGNITVRSGSTFVMQNSAMTTEATQASGGQITIITPEMVRVVNGRVSTSVAGSETDTAGGNIFIDPQFVVFQNSQVIAQANAGTGGAINVIAGVFIADPSTLVSASSASGPQGTVNIQSPVQNVGGELAALSDEFSSAAALLAQQCAARAADGKFSTFVVAAREGVPVEPGGFLASPLLTAELLGSRRSGQDPHTQLSAITGLFPKYEAQPIQLAKFGGTCR